MHEHFSSYTVGLMAGVGSIAIPDGVTSWLGKLAMGCAIALVTGLVHGLAKRLAAGKKHKE
jgi:hypothetical protein